MGDLIPSFLHDNTAERIIPEEYTSGFTFYSDPNVQQEYLEMSLLGLFSTFDTRGVMPSTLVHELWRTGREKALYSLFKAGICVYLEDFVDTASFMLITPHVLVSQEECFAFIHDIEVEIFKARYEKPFNAELSKEELKQIEDNTLEVISLVGKRVEEEHI